MIRYLLECIAFQLVFLVIYDLWLKKETFFQWNRAYLMFTYSISLVLPWVKLEAFRNTVPKAIEGYTAFLIPLQETKIVEVTAQAPMVSLSWQEVVYIAGMVLAALFLGYKMIRLYRLRRKGTLSVFPNFTRIIIADSNAAFSFFKSIFLGDQVLAREHKTIIEHELVHIKQWHSADLMFFELMRIVAWFDPLVYVYQARIAEVHEFIADAKVAKTNKKQQYQELLSQAFQTNHISFINHFFKTSLIKKRIVMLTKAKSNRILQLKYLLLLPFLFGMLCYTSCERESGTNGSSAARMVVADVENLSSSEEKSLISGLRSLADTDNDFKLSDATTVITFRPTSEGSFISGPSGELLPVQMTIDSETVGSDFSLFDAKSEQLKVALDGDSAAFGTVEEFPVFPGCEGVANGRECFQKMMQKHIGKNFRYPLEAQQKGIEGRVSVMFVINTEGRIQGLRTRGPHRLLEDEVVRIMAQLPPIVPGKASGKAVNVSYSIPVHFRLEGQGMSPQEVIANEKRESERIAALPQNVIALLKNSVPFEMVEQVPVFPGCEDDSDGRACFQKMMRAHITKHFQYPKAAQEAKIQGRVSVMFLISKEGTIAHIAKRGPDPVLEAEAERIISELPTMKPGKRANGDAVGVMYMIPITFKLQ